MPSDGYWAAVSTSNGLNLGRGSSRVLTDSHSDPPAQCRASTLSDRFNVKLQLQTETSHSEAVSFLFLNQRWFAAGSEEFEVDATHSLTLTSDQRTMADDLSTAQPS
ncbi:unnamed protein product [Pleuronectes platessa]|uniref:Uncharacterized protein n=1 Tax=Pleuronectes platessa TaxID=8262 RepID=A0A9N7TLR4_PLEPL|nr:unnamed protein product [Pleuronectes platessa]